MELKKSFIQKLTDGTQENEAVVKLLNYMMGDVDSYKDLTDEEKKLISEDVFNNLFFTSEDDIHTTLTLGSNLIIVEEFLHAIGEWKGNHYIREFNEDELTEMIMGANSMSYNVEVKIDCKSDFIHGYAKDDETFVIEGVEDYDENLEKIILTDNLVEKIKSDDKKMEIYNKYFNGKMMK